TRLDLPESIEFIGRYAFYGASNLDVYFESLMLPMGLQVNWDNGIKGYYVGVANVLTKGDWTYAELKNGNVSLVKYNGTATELDLNTLDLGADVETIGGYCFNNSNVTSVVLPQSLTHIQAYAFANSKITQITIPQNVRFIGQYAFFHTPLESVSFASDSKLAKIEQYAFAETRALQQISLPASLEQMGSYAFYQSGVKQVIFAENIVLQTIPEHAFASSKLQTVTLPYSVTLIDDNAFRDCLGLQNVSLPEQNDLSINSNAFYNTSLASVNIPANVIYVGEYAFVGLTNLNAFTVSADNPYYSSVDGLLYNKDGSKLISVPAGRTGSLQLPQTIQTIGFGAFENTKLSAVSFDPSANILTFGYRAFYAAENLTEITIPASVVSVDYYAFAMCKNLSKVTFAEGTQLKGVYEGAFYGCINLTDITLPDSIVEISDFAFYGCSNLTELPVSETNQLKGIYSYAFAYTGISELTLPETVTELGEYAFRGAKITSVVIPDTNAKELLIHLGAFADCNALTEITVPFIGASYDDEQITWFGYIFGAGAYTANNDYVPASLKTITVTEGITCLRTHSLYNLMNVEQINLPYSITTLEQYVFGETEARYEFNNEIIIDVETFGNYNYKYFGKGLSGRLILGGGKYLAGTSSSWTTGLSGLDYLESVELTNSFICIGRDAFNGLKSLRNVIIPETVSEIGLAFGGCNNLEKIIVSENNDYYTSQNGILYDKVKTKLIYIPKAIAGSITIPNSITSINSNENTFRNRSSLTNIIIPSSVISIDYYAFSGCSSLESITIPFVGTKKDGMGNTSFGSIFSSVPSSVKTVIITGGVVNDRAFLDCNDLENIVICDGVTGIGAYAFRNCSSLVNVILPNSVTSIGNYAFDGCTNLSSIIIPDSVKSIGDWAFNNCNNLTSITIPDSVTSIGSNAFNGCSSLTNVTFGKNSHCTSIGSNAFYNCSSLTSITIPDSVTSIGSNAFYSCSSLTTINYLGVIDDWLKIEGLENLMRYGSSNKTLSLNGEPITELVIPDTVTSIPSYAFAETNLTSVTIPDSVTSIGSSAFYGCNNIASAIIPTIAISNIKNTNLQSVVINSGSTIGSNAFYNCGSLTSITIPDSVTSIGSNAFYSCSSLTTINYLGVIDDWLKIEGLENLMRYGSSNKTLSLNGEPITELVIPDTVTSIPSYAFAETNLTSVTIPDSVTSTGFAAFKGCNEIESITIPFVGAIMDGTDNAYFGYIFGANSSGDNSSRV
ncbi:MAG: leucine-rich repeat protein, partial [Clostridia bacterium]|nr:leucine-rich repeat protein [Clostridia bacterium]